MGTQGQPGAVPGPTPPPLPATTPVATTTAPATAATLAAAAPALVFPVAGGIVDNVSWTGGPRITGKAADPITPFCFRPENYEKAQKVYKFAVTPLTPTFNGKENDKLTLTGFGKRVWEHLVMTGMDSVFYFTDSVTNEEYNIIDYYARFNEDEIKAQTKLWKDGNKFDSKNITWSGTFIYNSLSNEQQQNLEKYQIKEPNGPLIWMYVIKENRSNTERALETVRRHLEAMKISSYPGENVKLCCKDIAEKCVRLETAHRLPENVASTICAIFSKCSVEEFRTPFHERRQAADKNKNAFDYNQLIEIATASYQSMIDSGDWLAKSKNADEVIHGLMSRIATLEMKGRPGMTGKKEIPAHVRCFECQGNHYASNCPNKKQGGGYSNKGGNTKKTWKRTRPTAGGTTTKIVNGQTYQWCEHCNRWTTTHSTNEHRGKKQFGNRSSGGETVFGNTAEVNSIAETEKTSNVSQNNLSFMGYA
ncbi:MAG: hypothetical protein ACREBR_03380 [bacterium]